jgi:hypothetical protein
MFFLNVFLIAYLGFMAYWWSTQGLFSAMIHFVLTVMAGIVALAVWEPLAGMFMVLDPEMAWGIGLLLPFGVTLLVFRILFDRFVPGNLNFSDLPNSVGGAVFGLFSGILTTGFLVIGLMMIGLPSFFSYQPYTLDGTGKVVEYKDRDGSTRRLGLVFDLSVDEWTTGFFTLLSDNAFSPVFSTTTLGTYRPNFIKALATSGDVSIQGSNTRRTIGSDDVWILSEKDGQPGLGMLDVMPALLRVDLQAEGRRTVIVGLGVDRAKTADADGLVRIRPHQIRLSHSPESDFRAVTETYPKGYIHEDGGFISFDKVQEYVFSKTGVETMKVHFVFLIPMSDKVNFIEVKRARLSLRKIEPISDPAPFIAKIKRILAYPEISNTDQRMKDRKKFIVRGGLLPFRLNKNTLPIGAELRTVIGLGRAKDKYFLLRGTGVARKSAKKKIDQRLRVTHVFTGKNAATIKVVIGPINSDTPTLLDRISERPEVLEAPRIVDHRGQRFWAMGYLVTHGPLEFRFRLDPNDPITTLAALDLGKLNADDKLELLFQVPGDSVLEFVRFGSHKLVDLGHMRAIREKKK